MAGPVRPTKDLEWASGASPSNITAPSDAKRTLGWILEKPPLQYFNWWQNLVYKWQVYFLQMNSQLNQVAITDAGSTNASEQSRTYYMDATLGAQTLVLPTASTNEGVVIYVKKIDSSANTVTIQGTVEGEVNPVIDYQYTGRAVIAFGGNWYWRD